MLPGEFAAGGALAKRACWHCAWQPGPWLWHPLWHADTRSYSAHLSFLSVHCLTTGHDLWHCWSLPQSTWQAAGHMLRHRLELLDGL